MNRYYSNAYGRFMTPDPYQGNSGGPGDPNNPQSWNRYLYSSGDPVNRLDPEGMQDCPVDFCITVTGNPGNPNGAPGSGADGYSGKTPPWFQAGMSKAQYVAYIQTLTKLGKINGAIAKAVGADPHDPFTVSDLDCISGIETGRTWNPAATSSGGREGLFQFNQTSWNYSGTSIPWNNGQSALDPYTAASVALALLSRDLGTNGLANPTQQAVQTAIDKFGEHDGKYGQAVIDCANQLDNGDYAGALKTLQTYATWKASQ